MRNQKRVPAAGLSFDGFLATEYSEDSEQYRIGDLARELGVTLRTLRFYEDRGLVRPSRIGSTRIYSASDRARLKLVVFARQVGFPLVQISSLLALYDEARGRKDAAGPLLERFSKQLQALVNQRKELDGSIELLSKSIGYLRSIDKADPPIDTRPST